MKGSGVWRSSVYPSEVVNCKTLPPLCTKQPPDGFRLYQLATYPLHFLHSESELEF